MCERLRPFADILAGLLLVLLVDIVAFHFGLYHSWLNPDSYSGRVERTARRFELLRSSSPWRQVVVMGDSTAAHSIGEKIVESGLHAEGWPLAVANLAIDGSTARSVYHLLSHSDIAADNTALVVLGVHPMGLRNTENKPDLKILKTRLGLMDLWTLPGSYDQLETRLQVASGILFRSLLFREDLLELLEAPERRRLLVEKARQEEEARALQNWRRGNWSQKSLQSARLRADGTLDAAALEPWIRDKKGLPGRLEALLKRKAAAASAAEPMVIEAAQLALLEKAIRLLARRGIPVILAVTPEGPWPLPGHPPGPLEALVEKLVKEGLVVQLFRPSEMLAQVETPAHFKDLIHVNTAGAAIYSRAFTSFLLTALERSELKIEERRRNLGGEQEHRPNENGDQQGPQDEGQAFEDV